MKGVLLWRNRHCALSSEFETGRIFEATLGTLGQMSANALVHWPQNFIPSGFSKAHFEQRMVSGVPFQAPRSSSSAFASFKSAVSKPSVNQP
jgi:hypothetical protein